MQGCPRLLKGMWKWSGLHGRLYWFLRCVPSMILPSGCLVTLGLALDRGMKTDDHKTAVTQPLHIHIFLLWKIVCNKEVMTPSLSLTVPLCILIPCHTLSITKKSHLFRQVSGPIRPAGAALGSIILRVIHKNCLNIYLIDSRPWCWQYRRFPRPSEDSVLNYAKNIS